MVLFPLLITVNYPNLIFYTGINCKDYRHGIQGSTYIGSTFLKLVYFLPLKPTPERSIGLKPSLNAGESGLKV